MTEGDVRLKNKKVLVVGGSSGIGRAVARAALGEGAAVTIVGRSSDRLTTALEELQRDGPCRGIACDVTDESRVTALWQEVGPADHLVITAAGDLVYKPIGELTISDVQRVLNAKLVAAFLLVQRGLPSLAKDGSVVFTAGINAFMPTGKGSIISAVNGALIAYARALALELAPLRVNVVSPGWTDTPIWGAVASESEKGRMFAALAEQLPAHRIGRPDDVAKAVLMLLENGYMTGTVLHVDGGRQLV